MPTHTPSTSPPSQAPNDFADTAPRTGQNGTDSWFGGPWLDEPTGGASHVRPSDATTPYFFRVYRAFLTARATLAVMLILLLGALWTMGTRSPPWVWGMALGYATLACAVWWLPSQRQRASDQQLSLRPRQALASVGVDLVFFAALHYLTGNSFNTQALLVLPVLMAAVLMPRIMALGTAAAATINLLAAAWVQALDAGTMTTLMTQAGLTGVGLFVIAVLANELAIRLAREERSARGSMELARQQAELNRLVIEEMSEGVMVVDRQGRVRTANPAARRLLSARSQTPAAPFQLRGVPAWAPLVHAIEHGLNRPLKAEGGQEVRLRFDDHSLRDLRLRVRFTRGHPDQPDHAREEMCVMLLEDLRTVRARQRQDKLAAMGRMSAGIAHEIRNPLAAISQANALLLEDVADPAQHRLMSMVSDNVERLKRIVDDVMEVAPGAVQEVGAIDATAQVMAVCTEWARAAGLKLGEGSVLRIEVPAEPLGVVFDAEHLRRVLVNLLDNARRYASQTPGAIHLRLDSRHAAQAFLSIASDGAPIPPDVEPYLFEPFFSTRSRGTGLGLYICRELCERYGASLDYRLRAVGEPQRNEFFVEMRRRALSPAEARQHLTS